MGYSDKIEREQREQEGRRNRLLGRRLTWGDMLLIALALGIGAGLLVRLLR